MDHTAFRAWLDRYVDAWRLLDPVAIGDLFSADVRYAFDPFEVLAIDGEIYVAHGRTRYLTDDRAGVDREFANIFVCRFDGEGRCREFTEYYMRRRPEAIPD